ncbi:MAG: sigma-70 family RNA polymerase sigma factor [Desulfobacterales bacterium]|nr:sigma-70 family RNA polymerase sigma factor [Desulfobacterales bacterium]
MKRKKLTRKEEWQLLDECIEENNCEKLVQHYQGLVYHVVEKTLAKSSTDHTRDIENLCQDVFEGFLKDGRKNLRRYDRNRTKKISLSRWIGRFASWTVVKFLRKEGSPLSYAEISEKQPDEKADIEKKLEAKQMLDRLSRNCVLSDMEKKVFHLIFIEGFSPSEVSEILNIKTGNVYAVKSRAIKKLKKCMEELG